MIDLNSESNESLRLAFSRDKLNSSDSLDSVIIKTIEAANEELEEVKTAFIQENLHKGNNLFKNLPDIKSFLEKSPEEFMEQYIENIKDTPLDELTDVILVVLSFFAYIGVDVESLIKGKNLFNSLRKDK